MGMASPWHSMPCQGRGIVFSDGVERMTLLPIWIALAGALGVLVRYGVDRTLSVAMPSFPYATLTVNMIGSLLVGLVMALAAHERALFSREMALILAVGFLGGLTTFSAFTLQALQLLEKKQIGMAFLYLFGSPALGVLFAFLGTRIARI